MAEGSEDLEEGRSREVTQKRAAGNTRGGRLETESQQRGCCNSQITMMRAAARNTCSAAQVVHCTTPRGATPMDYNEKSAP